MDLNELIRNIAIYIIPVILGVALHEAAHAYAAKWLGDETAHALGRTSINPLKHIDPLGTVIMPLALLIMSGGSFTFGYAKPVPFNPVRMRRFKMDTCVQIVAFAGPLANLVMALGWAILYAISTPDMFGLSHISTADSQSFITLMSQAGILINLSLFAFNLFPLLPLDGGRVLNGFLPRNLSLMYEKLEPYGFWIIVIVSYSTPFIFNYWMSPIIRTILKALLPIISVIQSLIFK